MSVLGNNFLPIMMTEILTSQQQQQYQATMGIAQRLGNSKRIGKTGLLEVPARKGVMKQIDVVVLSGV